MHSKEIQYDGSVLFKSKTNIPNVTLEASGDEFETLNAIYTDDTKVLTKINIIFDTKKFKTGLYINEKRLYQQNFSWLYKNEKPVLFQMKMDKIVCLKQKLTPKFLCNGQADFLAGLAGFSRPLTFILDQNQNAVINLILSRKETGLPSPKKLGFEVDDKIWITLKVVKKQPLK